MILSMNSQDLLEGLNIVTRALSSRPAKQILEGVLISAEENRILMTCSDGSLTIEYTNTASVQEEGQTVIPGRKKSEGQKEELQSAVYDRMQYHGIDRNIISDHGLSGFSDHI